MTAITTEQIVEAGARAAYDEWRERHPGSLTWETDADWRKDEFRRPVGVALTAMLPLIRKQLADEVRGQCFTSEGAKFAIRQGRSVGEIQEFDAALEFAASLIEEAER